MQQDKNDMENKLRQLENQQLPDLSQMDRHWKAMNQMLTPAANAPGPARNFMRRNGKFLLLAASVTGIIMLVWVSQSSKEIAAKEAGIVNISKTTPGKIVLASDTLIKSTAKKNKLTFDPIYADANKERYFKEGDSTSIDKGNGDAEEFFMAPAFKDTTIKTVDFTLDKVENKINLSSEEKKMMLGELLEKIQKNAEVFTIDNKRDTVIKAKEGTVIFIPSNSFNTNEPVVFEIREFYKYSDMIANGLTTLSDGRQLVTGGMIHLSAKVKGKEVAINPMKEIRAFIPNITTADSMQIFEGVKTAIMDKIQTNSVANEKINWRLTKVRIDSPVSKTFIRAIDLRDDLLDYTVNYRGKTRAVFRMSQQSLYSKDELKAILKKKHGDYYDKIIVRKPWTRNLIFKKKEDVSDEEYGFVQNSWGVGDTAELLPGTVKIYKLTPIDTVYRIVRWINIGYRDVQRPVFPQGTLSNIGEKYSIGINKLGWINCDRFYNYEGRKSDFIVDLKDSSHNYITYLVFENFKSIMQGGGTGNYAVFPNVPLGQPVKVISMGIKDGKTVATVKSTTTSTAILKELSFESTSFTTLKSSLQTLDD